MALAFAREGADVLVSYYDEHDDARETARLIEEAGRKAVLVPGDIKEPAHCRAIVEKAVAAFGGIDVLVNNAAHQATIQSIDEMSDEEWDVTFRTNIHAMFYLAKAVVAHMKPGSAIVNTTSINATRRARSFSPTRRRRARSRTSPAPWRNCSPRRRSG